MKKLISLSLALILALGLVACGGQNTGKDEGTNAGTSSSQVTENQTQPSGQPEKEQEQEEYIEETVTAGEETVLVACPCMASIFCTCCKDGFKRCHDVRKEIGKHHCETYNEKCRPTHKCAVIQFLCHLF